MGRALAKSAASSSLASGVTTDFHVRKRFKLHHAKLAELRHLEQPEQRRQDLPGLSALLDELRPHEACLELQGSANDADGSRHVERARNDLVYQWLLDGPQDPVDGREELGE